jgi:hypothetical protein
MREYHAPQSHDEFSREMRESLQESVRRDRRRIARREQRARESPVLPAEMSDLRAQ